VWFLVVSPGVYHVRTFAKDDRLRLSLFSYVTNVDVKLGTLCCNLAKVPIRFPQRGILCFKLSQSLRLPGHVLTEARDYPSNLDTIELAFFYSFVYKFSDAAIYFDTRIIQSLVDIAHRGMEIMTYQLNH